MDQHHLLILTTTFPTPVSEFIRLQPKSPIKQPQCLIQSHHIVLPQPTKPPTRPNLIQSSGTSHSRLQDCALTGSALLNTPSFNKGAAFTAEEREAFKLTGLLPAQVHTLETQVKRAYQQYSTRSDALAKNTFMTSLKEQNEVFYYRVCMFFLCQLNVTVGLEVEVHSDAGGGSQGIPQF